MTSASDLPELVRDSKLEAIIDNDETVTTHLRPQGRRGIPRHEKWLRGKLLGTGGGGVVFLERKIEGAGTVELRAVKVIQIGGDLDSERHGGRRYVRELEALTKFSQDKYTDFFVKCYGWYHVSKRLYIAMEYCEYLDLGTYLKENKSLSEEHIQDVAKQILGGLSLMHENKFAHRDLKPANILIKSMPPEHWWVKLCDLGLSRRSDDASGSTTVRGTPEFMPPETLGLPFHGDPKLANPFCADMWCLGETISKALTGHATFKENQTLLQYQKGEITFPEGGLRKANASEDVINFVRSLMMADPRTRLTAEKASQHAWMKPDTAFTLVSSRREHLRTHSEPSMAKTNSIPSTDQITQTSGQWTTTMTFRPEETQPSTKPTETIESHSSQVKQSEQRTTPRPNPNIMDSGLDQQVRSVQGTQPNIYPRRTNSGSAGSRQASSQSLLDPRSRPFQPSQNRYPASQSYAPQASTNLYPDRIKDYYYDQYEPFRQAGPAPYHDDRVQPMNPSGRNTSPRPGLTTAMSQYNPYAFAPYPNYYVGTPPLSQSPLPMPSQSSRSPHMQPTIMAVPGQQTAVRRLPNPDQARTLSTDIAAVKKGPSQTSSNNSKEKPKDPSISSKKADSLTSNARAEKIAQLKKFSQQFKLKGPVPKDLTSVLDKNYQTDDAGPPVSVHPTSAQAARTTASAAAAAAAEKKSPSQLAKTTSTPGLAKDSTSKSAEPATLDEDKPRHPDPHDASEGEWQVAGSKRRSRGKQVKFA